MPRAGLESAIPATKRLQTDVLDRVATGIGPTPLILVRKSTILSEFVTQYLNLAISS
jgi:hypothetical protein